MDGDNGGLQSTQRLGVVERRWRDDTGDLFRRILGRDEVHRLKSLPHAGLVDEGREAGQLESSVADRLPRHRTEARHPLDHVQRDLNRTHEGLLGANLESVRYLRAAEVEMRLG